MTIDRAGCTARWHGTSSAYRYGCRCADAREADRLRRKRAREGRAVPGRVERLGTARRLRALAALGWPLETLAAELDMWPGHVKDMRSGRRCDQILRSTAVKIEVVYERLSGTPGPSKRVRGHAQRQGWASPMAWDGANMDDPKARPFGLRADEPTTYTPSAHLAARAEQLRTELEAAFPYSGEPYSWDAVAARLGVKPKTLEKARERARKAAA